MSVTKRVRTNNDINHNHLKPQMNDFTTRNHFYISDKLQSKIASSKVAFLGCGLSSSFAEVMVRTGFTHIFLCDGDVVDTSNLNRQNFLNENVSKSKANSLKNRLEAINPALNCSCLDAYLETIEQIDDELMAADIIVNTIDCGPLYFELIETYRNRGKLVLCPFNGGFMGIIVCFTELSLSSYDFFETDRPLDDFEIAKCLLRKTNGAITLPMNKSGRDFLEAVSARGYFPQLAIGGAITAAIGATLAVNYLDDKELRLAPEFYSLTAF